MDYRGKRLPGLAERERIGFQRLIEEAKLAGTSVVEVIEAAVDLLESSGC